MKLSFLRAIFLFFSFISFSAGAAKPVLLEEGKTDEEEQRYSREQTDFIYAKGDGNIYCPADSTSRWTDVYQKESDGTWNLLPPQDLKISIYFKDPSSYEGAVFRDSPNGLWKPVRMKVYKDRFDFLKGPQVLHVEDLDSPWGRLRYEKTLLKNELK